jgi:hypothetical protein
MTPSLAKTEQLQCKTSNVLDPSTTAYATVLPDPITEFSGLKMPFT